MKTIAQLIFITCFAFLSQTCIFSNDKFSENSNWTGNGDYITIKANENYVTKNIKVENFTYLNIEGSPEVIYTQKEDDCSVEVYTSDNIIDILDIHVKDKTLSIGFKQGYRIIHNKLTIKLSSSCLNGISLAGSSHVNLSNGLKSKNLNISIAGSGMLKGDNLICNGDFDASLAGSGNINCSRISCNNFNILVAGSGNINSNEVVCNELNASIKGSGGITLTQVTTTATNASIQGSETISISGNSENTIYNVAGSGNLLCSELQSKKVSANIAGSGNIKCHASDLLKTHIMGSGSIGYKGNPQIESFSKDLYKLK